MMGTEDDTASEEGTTQVCSRSHVKCTTKARLPCSILLCSMSLMEMVAEAWVLLCSLTPKAFLPLP